MATQEVAVCFGGKLMRGNRTQKVNSTSYQAFDSPTYPALATLGTNVDWDQRFLLEASHRSLQHWQSPLDQMQCVTCTCPFQSH